MPSTQYGNFHGFCKDSTLPICNLFSEGIVKGGPGYGGCELRGIHLDNNRYLRNLGVILVDGIGILVAAILIWLSNKKRAAVGRREMQIFLLGYMLIDLCEIFSVGGFPLDKDVRIAFTGIHIGLITATTWILMLNGAVGYQILDDGNFVSLFLTFGSATCLFIGTGYIALDTGYDWSGYWNNTSAQFFPERNYAMYTLYLLLPLVFLFVYFVLEAILVIKVLGELKPLLYLISATLLFAIGQVFDFATSVYICRGANGKIDGSFFETLFVLASVIMIWVFWSSITEDDWPQQHETQQEVSYTTE